MNLPTYWLAVAMAGASAVALAMVWRVTRVPPFPGLRGSLLSLLSTAWWAAVVAIEHASSEPASKVFWAEMAWFGIILSPGYWALFIWDYIHGQHRPAPRWTFWGMFGLAVLVGIVALTNDSHHLMYVQTIPTGTAPAMTINYIHGPVFFAVAVVFYTLMLVAEVILVFEVVRSGPLYRTHYIGLAVALLLPWIVNIGYATKTIMVGTADLTPLSFVAMNLVLLWLIARRGLFDLLPIAQDTLLDAMPDPVLVLDAAGRVAESNPAAQHLAGGRPLDGAPLSDAPLLYAAIGAPGAVADGQHEVTIGRPPRHFDLGQVTLTYAGRAVGRLILLRDITHRKAAEAQLQTALADLQKQLDANLALQQQLREEAIRDALTGLHNRRFFQELGPVMLAEAHRQSTPLAAAMIDIDHFKRLNDTHGHAAGDAALRVTGAFLRAAIRQSDMVFRMGGEEFLILLPRTTAEQALRRVDEWRAAFADETIVHEDAVLRATFSAGVAVFPDGAGDIDTLLSRADQALYRAKTGGRNRTEGWKG